MSVPSVPQIWIRPKVVVATNTLYFRWYAPQSSGGSQVTSYRLSSPQDPLSPYTIPSNNLAYSVNNLTLGTMYTYSIVAVNSFGSSPSATFRTMYIGPLPPQMPNTILAIATSSNSANILNYFSSGLDSYNIRWILARTHILYGTGVGYKNTVQFPQSTIFIDNNQGISNDLDLVNNMYSFDVTYVNDSGPSPVVKTGPIGNLQYDLTTPSKTYPYTNTSLISVACSSNGIIMVTGANTGGYLWTTRDRGVNWVQAIGPGAGAWNLVACSSDGTKMIAADCSPGYIWTSYDSGVTWTRRDGPGSRAWAAIGISFDGTKAVAAAPSVNVYTSSDSGVTWATPSVSFTLTSYSGITISNDGTTLFAAEFIAGGLLWKSLNSGSTWTSITNVNTFGDIPVDASWRSLRMLSDKTSLVVANRTGGGIYLSLNSGLRWGQIVTDLIYTRQGPYTGFTISPGDRQYMVFTFNNSMGDGAIYYSTTYGVRWDRAKYTDLNNSPLWWSAVTADSTGQYLTAISNTGSAGAQVPTPNTGKIWFSDNYGENWYTYENPGSKPWSSVGISEDSTTLVVVALPSYISNDSGITWKMVNFNNWAPAIINESCVFISQNKTVIAIAMAYGFGTQLFISYNSGSTWFQPDSSAYPAQGAFTPYGLSCVSGSSDGSFIIVGTAYGALFQTTNNGIYWALSGTPTNDFQASYWSGIACNSTAMQIVATSGGRQQTGYVWISRDRGVAAWTRLTSAPLGLRNWSGAASDSTGQYLYVCSGTYAGSQGYIWASANYGVTWTQCPGIPNANWSSISCSTNGANIVACVKGGAIWSSCNFGVTWVETISSRSDNWLSVRCSSNALSIITINSGGATSTPQNGLIKLSQLTG